MIKDNIILFSLINAFTYFLAMTYTTDIKWKFKTNLNELKEKQLNGNLHKYYYDKENKISKSVIILMVLFYSLSVFILCFTDVNLFKLVLLSIILITAISYLSKYNRIKALHFGIFNFNYFKNKFFKVKSKIVKG